MVLLVSKVMFPLLALLSIAMAAFKVTGPVIDTSPPASAVSVISPDKLTPSSPSRVTLVISADPTVLDKVTVAVPPEVPASKLTSSASVPIMAPSTVIAPPLESISNSPALNFIDPVSKVIAVS